MMVLKTGLRRYIGRTLVVTCVAIEFKGHLERVSGGFAEFIGCTTVGAVGSNPIDSAVLVPIGDIKVAQVQ